MVRFMFYEVLSGHSVENRLSVGGRGVKRACGNTNQEDISESKKELIMAWSVSAG